MCVHDMMTGKKPRSLLMVAIDLLNDQCPDEERMQLCQMENMDETDDPCHLCWSNFLFYVANGRKYDPYRCERLKET